MQLAQPLWILAGIVTCLVLAMVLHRMQKNRHEALKSFAGAQLLDRLTRHVSPAKRKFKQFLLLLTVFLLFVALARPQYGFKWVEVKRKGIDILFALDTSRSMLTEDTRPNRLQRAKLGILDFVEQLGGDRIGLLPFAGSSYLMCPLTLDYDAFAASLNSVTTDIIPLAGTNIRQVIRAAEQLLDQSSNHKVLVLITDGEDLEGSVIEAAAQAKENGMTIYTVGVGTADGELIPLPGQQAGFVKDAEGKFVTSRLDEEKLREIAAATGGIYAPLGSGGQGLETIYQQKLQLIPKEELAERRHKVPLERFSWPLAAAIILLVIDYLVPERKGNGSKKLPGIITAGRRMKKDRLAAILLALIFGTLPFSPQPSAASEGEKAYAEQDYLTAAEYYSEALDANPEEPVLHYNYGTAAYQNNLFDQAAASFTEALNSPDLELQQKTYFNLGNAHYKLGEEKQQADPQAAIKIWQEALESYDSALQLNPDDQLATENRAYVEQKLKELKEQLEQQQEQQQQDKSDNKQNDQQDSDGDPQQQQQQGGQEEDRNNDEGQQDPTQQQNQNGQDRQNEEKQEPSPHSQPEENEQTDDSQDNQAEQQSAEEAEQGKEGADRQRDLERRELGKMTREEAENLLNELKGEEGELNFVPVGPGGEPANSGREW